MRRAIGVLLLLVTFFGRTGALAQTGSAPQIVPFQKAPSPYVVVPVLLLLGQQTRLRQFFTAAAEFIARNVPDSQVWELPGAGHFAPVLAPESVADELVTFFEPIRQPV